MPLKKIEELALWLCFLSSWISENSLLISSMKEVWLLWNYWVTSSSLKPCAIILLLPDVSSSSGENRDEEDFCLFVNYLRFVHRIFFCECVQVNSFSACAGELGVACNTVLETYKWECRCVWRHALFQVFVTYHWKHLGRNRKSRFVAYSENPLEV